MNVISIADERPHAESRVKLMIPPTGDPLLVIQWADGQTKKYSFRKLCEGLEKLGILVEA